MAVNFGKYADFWDSWREGYTLGATERKYEDAIAYRDQQDANVAKLASDRLAEDARKETLRMNDAVGPRLGGGGSTSPAAIGGKGVPASTAVAPELTHIQRAFADTVSDPESGGNYGVAYGGYNQQTGKRNPSIFFDPLKGHPAEQGIAPGIRPDGRPSGASGRYAFIKGTWLLAAKQAGIDSKDFSPANQDRAFVAHAAAVYKENSRGRDLWKDLETNNFRPAVLNKTWTTFAGGEDGKSIEYFNSAFGRALERSKAYVPPTDGKIANNPIALPPQQQDRPRAAPDNTMLNKDPVTPGANYSPRRASADELMAPPPVQTAADDSMAPPVVSATYTGDEFILPRVKLAEEDTSLYA